MNAISHELAVALEASEQAETVLMKYYGLDIQIQQKNDLTPVTQADTEAEKTIIEFIRRRFPTHGFLGEETGKFQADSEFVWVIDPIDGTANFIRKIPLFGIQIALLRNDIPVLGVSRLPAMKEIIYGELGRGSYMNGRPIRTSEINTIKSAFVSIGGLNHLVATAQFENILNIVRSVRRIRSFGDAYAYHLLATGRCEAVIDARIRIWDVAALSVIIGEAGGTCTDWQGQKIGPNITSVVCSNGIIHSELIDFLQSAK